MNGTLKASAKANIVVDIAGGAHRDCWCWDWGWWNWIWLKAASCGNTIDSQVGSGQESLQIGIESIVTCTDLVSRAESLDISKTDAVSRHSTCISITKCFSVGVSLALYFAGTYIDVEGRDWGWSDASLSIGTNGSILIGNNIKESGSNATARAEVGPGQLVWKNTTS